MTDEMDRVTPPLDRALHLFTSAVEALIAAAEAGGLDHYGAADLIGVWQGLESQRNRLAVLDHHLIGRAEQAGLPEHVAQPNLTQLLSSLLRISAGEASRRVRAARAIGPRCSDVGLPLPPTRPMLAAAQRAGQVNPEQVAVIERVLSSVDRPGYDPGDVAAGERLLTGHAVTFGPKDLKILADRVVDAINPDGTLPADQLNHDRHLRLRPTRDGAYTGEFRLTGPLGAKLTALLTPLAKPRVTALYTDETARKDMDPRSHGQRMHDALDDLCDRMLRAGDLPDSGGTPATVIVTISAASLLARTGTGITSDGQTLSAAHVLDLAGEAQIVPVWLDRTGAILDAGRTRRYASPLQTFALIARDGGCGFPGCDHPPEFSERHHIRAWVDGGTTTVSNLTLLCRYHHQNFLARGWSCHLNSDGLPAWRPPRWVDRQQRPLVNTRIRARAARPEDLLNVYRDPDDPDPDGLGPDGLDPDDPDPDGLDPEDDLDLGRHLRPARPVGRQGGA